MFKVVEGALLKGTIEGANNEFFYGKSGRKTEDEYKQLLKDSQKYFEGIASGTISLEDNYFIYAPESYLSYGFASDIAVITNDKRLCVNAKTLFIDHSVNVKRDGEGYVYYSLDGRHRYTVAQKYKLKLLVNVLSEDEIKNESQKNRRKEVFWDKIKRIFKI